MRRELLLELLAAAYRGESLPASTVAGVTVTPEHVAGRVHALRGAGANVGLLVGDDGLLVVDSAFACLATRIRAAAAFVSRLPIRHVVNTHWHPDHTDGNGALAPEATLISTAAARRRLDSRGSEDASARRERAGPPVTFERELTLEVGGETVTLIAAGQAHTDGDAFVVFSNSNVVQTGDCFVTWGFPLVDLESGGSVAGLVDAVDRVFATVPRDAKVIPGHGPVSSPEDVLRYARQLRECLGIVRDAIALGWPREEVLGAGVLAPYAHLGQGFVSAAAFVDGIYREAGVQA